MKKKSSLTLNSRFNAGVVTLTAQAHTSGLRQGMPGIVDL